MTNLIRGINEEIALLDQEEDWEDVQVLEYVRDHVIPEFYPLDEEELKKNFQSAINSLALEQEVLAGEILLADERFNRDSGESWR